MKKGFTLIELLIIVVIVGILVTAAVAEYRISMEKARGLQGVNDIQALSDALNVYYMTHDYDYGNADNGAAALEYAKRVANLTKNEFFKENPVLSVTTAARVFVSWERNLDGNAYTLKWQLDDGHVTERYCLYNSTRAQRYCRALGATVSSGSGKMRFYKGTGYAME